MRHWRSIALSCALVTAITGALAVAAPRHEGAGEATAARSEGDQRGDRFRPLGRADRRRFEQHCTELTDAIGSELDLSGDKVRDAFKAVHKKQIESAVKAERLTREQADKIIDRIDSAACVPAGPPSFRIRMAAPGGGGSRGPFGHGEHPAPPPLP